MDPSLAPAPAPSGGARLFRVLAFALLSLAALLLVFGLGYGISELASEDDAVVAPVTAQAPAPVPAASPATDGDGDGGGDSGDAEEPDEPAPSAGRGEGELAGGGVILEEIYDILERTFVDKELLDERSMRDAAIRGAIDSLNDPYTEYISPADLQFGDGFEATYQGIGATVSDETGVIQIGAPFRGSPAEAAGIRSGDIILAVDGESTEGWSATQAVQRIRGPRGTEVVLTVRHTDLDDGGAAPEVEDIRIVRDEIRIESVYTIPLFEVFPGESGTELVDRDGEPVTDIAYVHISQVHSQTPDELRSKLADVEDGDYRGLIVDVRRNPGGLLRQTVELTDEFLDGGAILTEIDADGETTTYSARSGGVATSIPLVVIQDETSASGSEVVSAALADNDRALIVGVRSFGKGSVNQLHELTRCGDPAGCGAIYVTIGRWLRPSGDVIEGLGVDPDYEIPLGGDDYLDHGDLQLLAAIDLLRGLEPPPPPERPDDAEQTP